MPSPAPYSADSPTREQVDALPGMVLLDFGTNWCGHCQAAQQPVFEALSAYSSLRQIRVEDGPGRPLGRSFRVKLWPTLILLRDGEELARLVRPTRVEQVAQFLAQHLPAA